MPKNRYESDVEYYKNAPVLSEDEENAAIRKYFVKEIFKLIFYVFLMVSGFGVAFGWFEDIGKNNEPPFPKSQYVTLCRSISYEDFARRPDALKGQYFKFTGEVVQVIESGSSIHIRMNITPYSSVYGDGYEDTIYVTTIKDDSKTRILEEDIITVYGVCEGTYTYTSVQDVQITLPYLLAHYWELAK